MFNRKLHHQGTWRSSFLILYSPLYLSVVLPPNEVPLYNTTYIPTLSKNIYRSHNDLK